MKSREVILSQHVSTYVFLERFQSYYQNFSWKETKLICSSLLSNENLKTSTRGHIVSTCLSICVFRKIQNIFSKFQFLNKIKEFLHQITVQKQQGAWSKDGKLIVKSQDVILVLYMCSNFWLMFTWFFSSWERKNCL